MRDGFAYDLYTAGLDGDVASVRATAVPAGFEWVPGDAVTAAGATVDHVEEAAVDGRPAVRFSYPTADGAVADVLAIRDGDQLVELTYVDTASSNAGAAAAFLDSFGFAP